MSASGDILMFSVESLGVRDSKSFFLNNVAEGMAMALRPLLRSAQQSEQPSAIQSSSPGFSSFNTGRL